MPRHSRPVVSIALIVLLSIGALIVFFVSWRTLYQTFSSSLRPAPLEPERVSTLQDPTDEQARQLLEALFGKLPPSSPSAKPMDAKSLRVMLQVQGIDPFLLESLSNDDLMRLYAEFTRQNSARPTAPAAK